MTIALGVDEFKFRFKLLLIEHIFNENIKELQPLSIILLKKDFDLRFLLLINLHCKSERGTREEEMVLS